MNLNPIIEYIDNLTEGHGHENFEELIIKRNHFGKLPLELGQFIPCLNGKPLEKPNGYENLIFHINNAPYPFDGLPEVVEQCKEYETALSKVLFKGWELLDSSEHRMLIERKDGDIIGFFTDYIKVFDPSDNGERITTIESISHLNLILTKEGEKELI